MRRIWAPEAVLVSAGVTYERFEHEPTPTVADLRAHTEFSIEASVKTLAFSHSGTIVLVGVPGPARVDYAALARVLGVNRSSLRRADSEAVATLGVSEGGVSPIPTTDPIMARIVFDERVPSMGWVYCGGGRPELTLALDAADLVRLWPQPILGPIAKLDGA